MENYPPSIFDELVKQKRTERILKIKEENIKKVEDDFHKYTNRRHHDLAQRRRNRGLLIEGGFSDQIVPVKSKKRRPRAKAAAEQSAETPI